MRIRRVLLLSFVTSALVPVLGATPAHAAGSSPSGVQFSIFDQEAGMVSGELYAYDNQMPYEGTEPTGTITVREGSTTIGTFDAYHPQAGPIGTLTQLADRPAGTYTWTAEYSGDDLYAPSTSTATFTLYKRTGDITLSADKGMRSDECGPGSTSCDSSPDIDEGEPITFTSWVTSKIDAPKPYPDTSPGTVSFLDNGKAVGSAPVAEDGVAQWTTSSLPPGFHEFTARYNGNAYYASFTTDQPPWDVNVVPAQSDIDVARLAGDDRIATAIAISQDSFDDGGAGAVVLTTGNQFADALGGTPLAIGTAAPILLTPSGAPLDARTRSEIERVLAPGGTVFVLGGEGAVPGTVDDELRDAGNDVVRIAGANRFETAVAIADARTDPPTAILLADGMVFPDALAGGAAAGHIDGVVLLTNGSTMPASTQGYVDDHPDLPLFALGGHAAAAAPSATAIAGRDRYETAYLVAKQFFEAPEFAGVASGESFPDALGGGAEAGEFDGPLLLARYDELGEFSSTYVNEEHDSLVVGRLYGGTATLSPYVEATLRGSLQ